MLTKNKTTRPSPVAAVYWLISKEESDQTEILTIERGGGEALPVFSFREEAEMFLALGAMGEGWSVGPATAGELASILAGPCSGTDSVSLDPLPEMVCRETLGLVSVSRERFMRRLTRKT